MKKKNPLTIRGLDVRIIEHLKERARMHAQSLEAEMREILTHAAREPLILDALVEADRIAAMTPRSVPQIECFALLGAGDEP